MYGRRGVNRRTDLFVDTKDIENIIANTDSPTSFDNEYLYGPSVEFEQVEIDGVDYPFRQFDPNKILIYQTEVGGSCPFVYAYSSMTHHWVSQGVILYGRNGFRKKAVDRKE